MSALTDIARKMKELGQKSLRLDRVTPELLVEALTQHTIIRYRRYEDAQIIGMFHVYVIIIDGVEITLETTKPITKEEAETMKYTGLGLEEVRRLKNKTA